MKKYKSILSCLAQVALCLGFCAVLFGMIGFLGAMPAFCEETMQKYKEALIKTNIK